MLEFKGRDKDTGESYEDKFCKNSQQMGVAILGDSVSAHFHLPEQWFGMKKRSFYRPLFHNF